MTSAYTWLASRVLFPVHEALKNHGTVRLHRELERSQWLSAQEIAERQAAHLRAFVTRIASRVPYYRDLFASLDIAPEAIRGAEDLARLPFLTKDLIRRHADGLRSSDAGPLKRFNTGGSTGEPLIFHLGRERIAHDVAAKWRATRWWGVDIGDPELVVWGSPVELGAQDRLREWRDRLLRSQLLPAFEMSPANLERFVAKIRQTRPAMLFGYPSSLALIARHAERCGQRMDDLGVRVVFVTSERLYDDQKATLERVFGCPTANGYGGRDAGFIAHQCPHGGMHLSAEHIVVEIVDPEGRVLPPGQAGEVVVTHTATGEYPFLRYRTGDVAVLDDGRCPCGRGLPMLRDIQGRTTDFIVAPDGTVMHGLALIYVLRDQPGVEAFKIIQESVERLRVLVVPGEAFTEDTERAVVTGLSQRLGEGVTIEVEKVSDIPRERSGKFRYVVSKVVV